MHLQAANSGSNASLAVQAASSQLQSLIVIGSSALAGVQERSGGEALDADSIASAVYAALGDQMQANTAGAQLLGGGRGSWVDCCEVVCCYLTWTFGAFGWYLGRSIP